MNIKRSTYMKLYSRIVANLLVILVRILVNLLAKPTKSRLGGGHGGAYPLYYEPLPGCMVAPRLYARWSSSRGVVWDSWDSWDYWDSWDLLARLALLVRPVILARLLAMLLAIARPYKPFYRSFGLSWEVFLVISRVVFTLDYLFTYMFFFQKSSSGGITSSNG